MIVVPSGTSTWCSLMVSFGISVLACHELFKFAPEFGYKTADRHDIGICQWTDRLALHHIRDLVKQVHIRELTFTRQQVSQNSCRPAGTLATGRALAARLVSIEVGDYGEHLGHSHCLVEDDDTARTEHRACFCQRLIVQRYTLALFGLEHRNRAAAGNDRLQLAAVFD